MEKSIRKNGVDPEIDPNVIATRNALFQRYVAPYFNMIYKLCKVYTYDKENVQENYNEVLANFYRRINTYDPKRSILTWLHIVTKRQVADIERKRKRHENYDNDCDVEKLDEQIYFDDEVRANGVTIDNYRTLYSDDILSVLDMLQPIHRDPLLLQMSGYSLKEITEIEYQKGAIKSCNIEAVKRRLFFARGFLKKKLTRDGKRRTEDGQPDDTCFC